MPPRPLLRRLTRLYIPFRQTAAQPKRTYAFRGVYQPAASPAPPVKHYYSKVEFTVDDVPPLSYWKENVVPPLVPEGEVTPRQCLDAVRRYVDYALKNESGWRERHLTTDATPILTPAQKKRGCIPFFTLQYASAIMMMRSQGYAVRPLITHILHSGTLVGYAPAVLTLVRTAMTAGKLDLPSFGAARAAFDRLISRYAADQSYRADALTLAGLMALRRSEKSNDKSFELKAMGLFERAKSAAYQAVDRALTNTEAKTETNKETETETETETEAEAKTAPATKTATTQEKRERWKAMMHRHWQWRTSAVTAKAKHYALGRDFAGARQILSEACEDLDSAEICHRLALILGPGDPEGRRLLERAAVSGVPNAARQMSRLARDQSKEIGISDRERRTRELLAKEWSAVAGDMAIYEGVRYLQTKASQVAEAQAAAARAEVMAMAPVDGERYV